MKSSLRERLERLGPVRAVALVPNGSSVVFTLRVEEHRNNLNAVGAALSLCEHGLTMLRAKRAVERLIDDGEVTLAVPKVGDIADFRRELANCGVRASAIALRDVNVRELRESLSLTQEQFALRYGFELDAVRNWEHGRRSPDTAARSYLRVIERMPDAARKAQEDPLRPDSR